MEAKEIPTLYKWVGGIERLEALFRRFYERVPDDPILAPVFRTTPAIATVPAPITTSRAICAEG